MDSSDKVLTLLLLSSVIVVSIACKGCNDSDNKTKQLAIQKQCLILPSYTIDCRDK